MKIQATCPWSKGLGTLLLAGAATLVAGCSGESHDDGGPARLDGGRRDGGPTKVPTKVPPTDAATTQDGPRPTTVNSGFRVSKSSDFSTEDVEFSVSGALYVEAWSSEVDAANMKTQRVEVTLGENSVKQDLLYEKGLFRAAVKLAPLAPLVGAQKGLVQGVLEDNGSGQWDFSAEITLTE